MGWFFVRKPAKAVGLVLTMIFVAGVLLGAASLQPAQAASGIVFDGSPGTGAPPATLGPYPMTPFPEDGRTVGLDVSHVPGPTGDLGFDQALMHRRIGSGWSTWSHGYMGDVYGAVDRLTMTLPPSTYAFYFYAEPNNFGWHSITATAQDGTTSGPVDVEGSAGATYFGFYSTGSPIVSITVESDAEAGGFAVGEFGIYTGEPIRPSCARADLAVVIYGGWDGIPVSAYVGGTAQETLYTARDAFGNPAVLWTFYPAAGGWPVSVAPQLPAGLDPARWQYKLVGIRSGPSGPTDYSPGSASATITPCSERVFYFQLVDTGALAE